jgi:hypothetical protein
MYFNQIDNIIDNVLDKLYLEALAKPNVFQTIIDKKKINFVEYQSQINDFIKGFVDSIDTNPIQKLINNKENLQRILNIIKRYVAYYCFLYMAYFYAGTIKDFRNNLIQFSKLQEISSFRIENFFDTENNYQLIMFFKIIHDSKKILLMTPLQRKTLNETEVKLAVNFLEDLGSEYIDNFILEVRKDDTVQINTHNLIKTIVFREIYKNQEQTVVYKIISDIEERENEYKWIEIVVSTDLLTDFNFFRSLLAGEEGAETLAQDLFELINKTEEMGRTKLTLDKRNNNLLLTNHLNPIVDDFLRYHKDTERLDFDQDKTFVLSHFSKNNAKNVQLALIRQHKQKKENTKAQLIINKVDMISDLYSENVKTNPESLKQIKNFFYKPLAYRKTVLYNYLDEIYVMRKMELQGKKVIDRDEYYLELKSINRTAYFNFKDFQKYGTSLVLNTPGPINVVRHCNIEFLGTSLDKLLDTRTAIPETIINMTGLSIGPLKSDPIECSYRNSMVDIRTLKIVYKRKSGEVKELQTTNGYQAFIQIVRHFIVKTIALKPKPNSTKNIDLFNNFDSVQKLNPGILSKIIYWIYDIELDSYPVNTYENIKRYDFQENIKFMNGIIYDKVMQMLHKQLVYLIKTHLDLPLFQIERMIQIFINRYHLNLTQSDRYKLIVTEYLSKAPKEERQIIEFENKLDLPEYTGAKISPPELVFEIKINMTNPLHIKEWTEIKSYLGKEVGAPVVVARCKHEAELKEIMKLKQVNLNEFNKAITQFIYKYALETTELYFVCRLCSQFLPMKEYYQDGKFNNTTQKYTTNYVPINIPLDEIKEYTKYSNNINHIDGLVKRLSLITGTNMLTGTSPNDVLKRKSIIKNILDIILKHNQTNLKNPIQIDKEFGIDKNISNVFYFELSDNIYDNETATPNEIELNRLKFNNIILYFIWIFITELNPMQIIGMTTEKIANIYVVEKYGDKIFQGLLMKKNINGKEKVPITDYPVLCYVLYMISYMLVKYGIWYSLDKSTKVFNAFVVKSIVHSLVELFNGFVIKYAETPDDYVYTLTVSKIYVHLNTLFKNTDVIRLLEQKQLKYISEGAPGLKESKETKPAKPSKTSKSLFISLMKPRKFTFKVSTGIMFYDLKNIPWQFILTNTNLTNCPSGDFHKWVTKANDIICLTCGEKGSDLPDKISDLIDRTNESFYFNLNKIAMRKCLDCRLHVFEQDSTVSEANSICSLCKKMREGHYTHDELDQLNTQLHKIDDEFYQSIMDKNKENEEETIKAEEQTENVMKKLINLEKNHPYPRIIDNFITSIAELLGTKTNLGSESYPSYLQTDTYIINHSHTGAKLNSPITFTEKDHRILFKEDHPHFHVDVFYYVNKEVGSIEVFYHAVTLELLGYKESHKEYVNIKDSRNYLIINRSIQNKLKDIGFKSRYLNISHMLGEDTQNSNEKTLTYYEILDNEIRTHINVVRDVVDKIISILSTIRNHKEKSTESIETMSPSPNYEKLNTFVAKYSDLLGNFNLGSSNKIFDDWNDIRDVFSYEKINWGKTNVKPTASVFVNSNIINQHCKPKDLMLNYVVSRMADILESVENKADRMNWATLYVDLINYIFGLYDQEALDRMHDLKRFKYILAGSKYIVDLLRKGQGLVYKELEKEIGPETTTMGEIEISESKESKEEKEEAIESAQALDVEQQYYEEENEEYGEGNEESED